MMAFPISALPPATVPCPCWPLVTLSATCQFVGPQLPLTSSARRLHSPCGPWAWLPSPFVAPLVLRRCRSRLHSSLGRYVGVLSLLASTTCYWLHKVKWFREKPPRANSMRRAIACSNQKGSRALRKDYRMRPMSITYMRLERRLAGERKEVS